MSKLSYIKNIEDKYNNEKYNSEIDKTKPKFFACFPYPYMNGKLHLGHAYTMLKVDYECRFKKINGYNVLFPFGFHVTGIPIYAASLKLKKEIETNTTSNEKSQYQIMKNFGIPDDQISEFIDPLNWVRYFPHHGINHVSKLNLMIDKRRSFVTTELNPFYDSFVKWQFNKLHQKGYLKFGTRNSIYSEALQIQCQDHDRTIGEGIQNSNFKIHKIQFNNDDVWILYQADYEDVLVDTIQLSKYTKFNKYVCDNKNVYMTEYVYKNYQAQYKTLELIDQNINIDIENNDHIEIVDKHKNDYYNYTGGCVTLKNEPVKYNDITINMPTDFVIDKMGGMCIVKPVEQWYIDYANSEWKKLALECLNQMKLTDQIKNGLQHSINWLKEWGVSRTFGLGTKIPFDDRFIIDSLSDSTLYPAYYTISHLLHRDLYGHDSDFNFDEFTFVTWDYIFLGIWSDEITIDRNKLDQLKESFDYFYPVDTRISGKDLMSNHLPMYIFNHCAIFNSDKWPKSINCNGWILVDGEKMAKSNGNFITIENELLNNSIDSVRLTLADAGDNLDDANYEIKKAKDIYLLKIYNFVDHTEKMAKSINEYTDEIHYIDLLFLNVFNRLFSQIIKHYDVFEYKNVVRDALFVVNNTKEKYRTYAKYFNKTLNKHIMLDIIKIQLSLLYPIIPLISQYSLQLFGWNIHDININDFNLNYDVNTCELFDKMENTILYIREKNDKNKKKNKPLMNCVIENSLFDDNMKKIMMEQLKVNITHNKPNNNNDVMKVKFTN